MKTNTSLPYLDRLDPERQAVFSRLAAFKHTFTLAGGTAIMLQIGHRQSYDFDCFSQKELSPSLFQKIKRVFGKQTRLILKTGEFLFVMTPGNIELNFVYYPFAPLKPPKTISSINIFHLDDLVSNKAYTLGRRPQWRDYVDLFFLLKWKLYTIESILSLSQKKFGGEFNDKLFLKQLTYLDDVEVRPTVFLKESYSEKGIKEFLEQKVDKYLLAIH